LIWAGESPSVVFGVLAGFAAYGRFAIAPL
jgi:hypothetical protein